jgi:hypothetical protein
MDYFAHKIVLIIIINLYILCTHPINCIVILHFIDRVALKYITLFISDTVHKYQNASFYHSGFAACRFT